MVGIHRRSVKVTSFMSLLSLMTLVCLVIGASYSDVKQDLDYLSGNFSNLQEIGEVLSNTSHILEHFLLKKIQDVTEDIEQVKSPFTKNCFTSNDRVILENIRSEALQDYDKQLSTSGFKNVIDYYKNATNFLGNKINLTCMRIRDNYCPEDLALSLQTTLDGIKKDLKNMTFTVQKLNSEYKKCFSSADAKMAEILKTTLKCVLTMEHQSYQSNISQYIQMISANKKTFRKKTEQILENIDAEYMFAMEHIAEYRFTRDRSLDFSQCRDDLGKYRGILNEADEKLANLFERSLNVTRNIQEKYEHIYNEIAKKYQKCSVKINCYESLLKEHLQYAEPISIRVSKIVNVTNVEAEIIVLNAGTRYSNKTLFSVKCFLNIMHLNNEAPNLQIYWFLIIISIVLTNFNIY